MNKIIKMFVYLFVFVAVFFSLQQLTFKNTIFANAPKACCNDGDCHTVSCSNTATVALNSNNCIDVTIDCAECLDYFAETPAKGDLCEPLSKTVYCLDNGVKYYGDGVWETRTITFNNTYPSGGSYTMGGTNYTPVTSDDFTYLSTQSLSATNFFTTGTSPNILSWKFDRWNFGSSSNPINYQITSDATVYAIYKRWNDPAKNSSTSSLETSNYPNPFNPQTTISYQLEKPSKVKLTIYNSLGEMVELLVNEYQIMGRYEVNFNALDLPSGIYFYNLETGLHSITKQMILIK